MSDSPSPTGSASGIDDREVLDAVGAAVIVTDGSGRIVQWNSTSTEMFGWLGEEAPRRIVQTLLASGGPQRRAASTQGARAARLVPLMLHDGRVSVFAVERTELIEPGRSLAIWTVSEVGFDSPWGDTVTRPGSTRSFFRADGRGEHTEVITDLGLALGGCDSTAAVLEAVPRHLVPRIADWCGVFLLPESGIEDHQVTMTSNAVASKARVAEILSVGYRASGSDAGVKGALREVIASGRRSQVDLSDPRSAAGQGFNDRMAHALGSNGIHTSLMVPLSNGGRPFGALHLLRGADFEPFNGAETNWVGQMAVQIAGALAPLRESDRNQDLAVIFQEALLPDDFPSIDGIEVAARYRPGIADVEVGGDFYDIVTTGSDRWALIIGDICGRGPAAAAQTGRARHSFRMSAWHEDMPVEILDWLDQALRTGGDGILCTAAVASLERTVAETLELTCALGGHPQPILCRAAGSVEYFGEYGTLLGTDLTMHNVAVSTLIEPGDAVFFYTDGITDAPPPHHLSQRQLLGLVGEAWADRPDASVLADRVLAEADRTLSLDERTDDIALLVLRRTT